MLPVLPSLRQLKDYLDEQNLKSKCQTTDDASFLKFVDGDKIEVQNSYVSFRADARWWISYHSEQDIFKLNVSHFTNDGVGITQEEFSNSFPLPHYATSYTEDKVVYWTKGDGQGYNIVTPDPTHPISRVFSRDFPTITKIA